MKLNYLNDYYEVGPSRPRLAHLTRPKPPMGPPILPTYNQHSEKEIDVQILTKGGDPPSQWLGPLTRVLKAAQKVLGTAILLVLITLYIFTIGAGGQHLARQWGARSWEGLFIVLHTGFALCTTCAGLNRIAFLVKLGQSEELTSLWYLVIVSGFAILVLSGATLAVCGGSHLVYRVWTCCWWLLALSRVNVVDAA